MDCKYKEKTILYFYGELSEKENIEFKKHIENCQICREELYFLKKLSLSLNFKVNINKQIEEKIINYSKEIIYTQRLSLIEKIYSFAFSMAVILFFIMPLTVEKNNYDIETQITSLEDKLISFKYELLDISENYEDSYTDYSEISKNEFFDV